MDKQASDLVERVAAQRAVWENRLKGARLGNPYATLCLNCYGRHGPPFDDLCPRESIAELRARLRASNPVNEGGGGD